MELKLITILKKFVAQIDFTLPTILNADSLWEEIVPVAIAVAIGWMVYRVCFSPRGPGKGDDDDEDKKKKRKILEDLHKDAKKFYEELKRKWRGGPPPPPNTA